MVSGVRFQVSGIGGAQYCWDVGLLLLVVVLVLVLDLFGNGLHKLDYEDEKQSYRFFRELVLKILLPNCPVGGPFPERSLGKSLVPNSLKSYPICT
jgi:hypothetical protein